jgi:hypothetical protein
MKILLSHGTNLVWYLFGRRQALDQHHTLVDGAVTTAQAELAEACGVCPAVGQTVPKRPLWDTFRAEKPKVFWAFSVVQMTYARHLPRAPRSRLAPFPTSTNMDEGSSLAGRSPDRTARSVKRVTLGLEIVSPEAPNFPLTPLSIKPLYCGDFCGDPPYKYASSDVYR